MNTTSDPQSPGALVRRAVALVTALAAVLMLTPIMMRPAGAAPAGYAGVPGKNGLIAFTEDDAVWVMNPDGTDRRLLTNTPDRLEFSPAWSPDGVRIAFVGVIEDPTRDVSEAPDIYVMDADGTNVENVTNTPDTYESEPAWSPDGSRIAFDAQDDVFVMDADGTNVENVTNTPDRREYSPAWSPDGSRIVFDAWGDGTVGDVFVMDADGRNVENVTNTPDRGEGRPAWSPDGTRIAFGGYDDFSTFGDIFAMDADGRNVDMLTNTQSTDEQRPDWSPDGTRIAFEASVDEVGADGERVPYNGVFVMDADGSNIEDLGPGFSPDWQPLRDAKPVYVASGITVDSRTGQPVPHVIVTVYEEDYSTVVTSTVSDHRGRFEITANDEEFALHYDGSKTSHETGWQSCFKTVVPTPGEACTQGPGFQGNIRLDLVTRRPDIPRHYWEHRDPFLPKLPRLPWLPVW